MTKNPKPETAGTSDDSSASFGERQPEISSCPRRRDTCIIYIHGNRWDGVPARQRYLTEQMARYADVVYLEEAEDRKWRVTKHNVAEGIEVVRGLMPMWLRFHNRGWLGCQKISARWYLRKLRARYKRIILWDAENWLRCYRFVPHDLFVYDCIDPCFSESESVKAAFDERERDVVRNADLVFASAETLAASCRGFGGQVVLLNNASAPGEYGKELVAQAARPAWWPTTSQPVVSYLGSVDWRFDFEAVERACEALPAVSFVLAGNILEEFALRMERLAALPNVICPGRISVEEGRYLLANCRAGLIPFTTGAMNDGINPVKMYAYALLGKPIAGTAIRELILRPELVYTASEAGEFPQAVVRALTAADDTVYVARLKDFALRNTWGKRADQAWRAIEALGTGQACQIEPLLATFSD